MLDKEYVIKAIGAPLVNSKKTACCITDITLKFVFVNDAFCKLSGYSREELLEKPINILLEDNFYKQALSELAYVLKNGNLKTDAWVYYTKSGEKCQATTDHGLVEIEGKTYAYIIATDNTKESELEYKLQEEKRRLETVTTSTEIGMWDLNFKTRTYITNNTWWKMLGYEPFFEDDIEQFFRSILHPDDEDYIAREFKRLKGTGSRNFETVIRLRTSDGDYRSIQSRGKVLQFDRDNNAVRIVGVHIDITEQINLSKELDQTRELLELTEELTKKGSFEYDLETGKSQWTPGMYRIYEIDQAHGTASQELSRELFSEDGLNKILSQFKTAVETNSLVDFKTAMNFPDDRTKHLHIVAEPSKTNPNSINGTVKDITDQVLAENRIKASEEKYRLLTETIPHIIWRTPTSGELTYINKYGAEYFGLDPDHDSEWTLLECLHPEEKDRIVELWQEINQKKSSINHSHRIRRKDGTYRWFQVVISPQFNDKNEIKSWTGIASDINDQVEISESLRVSNARLRSLINASPVAIYSIDVDGVIRDFWNPAAEELFGWKHDEVIDKHLPHAREENHEEIMNLIKITRDEGTVTQTVKRTDRYGNNKILEITGGAVYDKEGEVSEILVTVMDKTEIQQSLKEKETLLQEIHHRVKNNLAIVVSLLQLQVYRSSDETEKYRLTQAQNRVYSIAMVHELLYQSDEFSKVDLTTYYDKLITSIKTNMQMGEKNIRHDLQIGKVSLNINQAIPLGLLINELVTNSFKYAFNNDSANDEISLSIDQKKDTITVIYTDSGPGFKKDSDKVESGLGMQIIESLIDQLDAQYVMETDGEFRLSLMFKENNKGSAARTNY